MINKILKYEESHKEINGQLHKLCKICEEWFPCNTENFYKSKGSKDGLYPYCKKCNIAKSDKYIKGHLEQHKAYDKKNNRKEHTREYNRNYGKKRREEGKYRDWQLNNPDKLKQYHELYSNKKHKISTKEWVACKKYFDNECAYCGLPLSEHYFTRLGITKLGDFHKEHVDCNGSDDLGNCVPSCKSCNTSKNTYELEEWYSEDTTRFNQERLDKIHKWLNEDYKLYIQE